LHPRFGCRALPLFQLARRRLALLVPSLLLELLETLLLSRVFDLLRVSAALGVELLVRTPLPFLRFGGPAEPLELPALLISDCSRRRRCLA